MSAPNHDLDSVKTALSSENAEIEKEQAQLTARHADLEKKRQANLGVIKAIEERARLASQTLGPIVDEIISDSSSPYGAIRKSIREACEGLDRFDLDMIARLRPQIPRTVVANTLWNLEKSREIEIAERIGDGPRAKRVYRHATRLFSQQQEAA